MRLVLDVNTLVSGLLRTARPAESGAGLALQADQFRSAHRQPDDVLHREKFVRRIHAAGISAHDLVADITRLAEIVTPSELPALICRDPDDDVVLATAIGGQADAVVSGDRDLAVLRRVDSIPILAVQDALALLTHR